MSTAAPVDGLDGAGDGLATLDGRRRTVPLALPGDEARFDGEWVSFVPASPHRVEPPCALFAACGGCRMLHAGDALYEEWKLSLLRDAFAEVGLSPAIRPMARSPLPSRRRMTITATTAGGGAACRLFRPRKSHHHRCPGLPGAGAGAQRRSARAARDRA